MAHDYTVIFREEFLDELLEIQEYLEENRLGEAKNLSVEFMIL